MGTGRYTVGIDNGVSGALALIDSDGFIVDYEVVPVRKGIKPTEIWSSEVWRLLHEWKRNGEFNVIIEKPVGSKSLNAAKSMAASYNSLLSVLDIMGITPYRVAAKEWHDDLLGKFPSGESKIAALNKAKKLWPTEDFLASKRCSTPHDGIVDALLIAKWGQIKRL